MTIFGLVWYEIVMLVLGVLLFVVLLTALRSALAAGKSYVGMLPFFVLTIAMIGYPSIQSIQYKDGMVEIERDTSDIESGSADVETRQTFEANLKRFGDRAASAKDKQAIARAQAALKAKKADESESNNSKKPNTDQTPNSPASQQSQKTVELRERVQKLTQQAEGNPKDAALRNQLVEAARQLKASGSSDPVDAAVIKRAENFLAPWGQTVN
jgi:hypothetical protein